MSGTKVLQKVYEPISYTENNLKTFLNPRVVTKINQNKNVGDDEKKIR